jgi:hypothetical protein
LIRFVDVMAGSVSQRLRDRVEFIRLRIEFSRPLQLLLRRFFVNASHGVDTSLSPRLQISRSLPERPSAMALVNIRPADVLGRLPDPVASERRLRMPSIQWCSNL